MREERYRNRMDDCDKRFAGMRKAAALLAFKIYRQVRKECAKDAMETGWMIVANALRACEKPLRS